MVRYPSHCLVPGVRPRRLPGTSADAHEAYEAERCGTELGKASESSELSAEVSPLARELETPSRPDGNLEAVTETAWAFSGLVEPCRQNGWPSTRLAQRSVFDLNRWAGRGSNLEM